MDPITPQDFQEIERLLASFPFPVSPRAAVSPPLSPARLRGLELMLAESTRKEDRLRMFAEIVHDDEAIAYLAARLRGEIPPPENEPVAPAP